jgi:hypothetical protein
VLDGYRDWKMLTVRFIPGEDERFAYVGFEGALDALKSSN